MSEITSKKMPIVWSIGGSDSSGGSGIQADLHTFHDFGVHGCTVITALNAQNSFAQGHTAPTERKNVVAQINALDSDMPADAIKLGMLPNREILETVIKYFDDYSGYVCYDLELDSSGEALMAESALIKEQLFPRVDLLVANTSEVDTLLDIKLENTQSVIDAAAQFLNLGVRAVLITGAQFDGSGKRYDYWSDGKEGLWLTIDAIQTVNNQGGGCTLSAAVTAMISRGAEVREALSLAKAYVTQGIRGARQIGSGPGSVAHLGLPEQGEDAPVISEEAPS